MFTSDKALIVIFLAALVLCFLASLFLFGLHIIVSMIFSVVAAFVITNYLMADTPIDHGDDDGGTWRSTKWSGH